MGTLKKLELKPGVDRESTSYVKEGTYFESDKVRFRSGTPEKIGGWQKISNNTYLGYARTLLPWITLDFRTLVAMGTHLKYYVVVGGSYKDITPIRLTTTAGAITFAATNGSNILTVTNVNHGAILNDFVTYSGAVGLGGNVTAAVLNQNLQITKVIDGNTYQITLSVTANASDTGNGGTATVGAYEINTGMGISGPLKGWGTGWWGQAPWGLDGTPIFMRVWTQATFGANLVFGPYAGAMYYFDSSLASYPRAVRLDSLPGANQVPTIQNIISFAPAARITIVFGTNDPFGAAPLAQDPLLIRWSDVNSITQWNPTVVGSQAGSYRVTVGTQIMAVQQTRQEILVFTDIAMYSMQYVGAPYTFSIGDPIAVNISIASQNAVATASNVVYWMGKDKFYMYDGRVSTLECSLREYVFSDFNYQQAPQVICGTVEAFGEVWWWYCSANSTSIDRYVAYNYLDKIWFYGTMTRTAWIDRGVLPYPTAATYSQNLCYHEFGNDDYEGITPKGISCFISSSEFDIEDGDRFGFIWRILPDITFRTSTATNPQVLLTLIPLRDSGSGYDAVQGETDMGTVTGGLTIPIEQYTRQINIRVRGRQLIFRISSDGLGVAWQSGYHRIDIRKSGKKAY